MINHNIVERSGKQLLVNGKPLADVCDERYAEALYIILLRWQGEAVFLNPEEKLFLNKVFSEIT